MSIPTLTVTPASAANAYARVQSGGLDGTPDGDGFGSAITRAIQGVIDSGHNADAQSMQAIAGQGNLTELATAVSKAELALQTAIAVRDRVVQAYQDVSRMAI
jgi:flagellar hook-basal body complex protein FliE